MKATLIESVAPVSYADLGWRVLACVNLFRLIVPLSLAALFETMSPAPVGQVYPALFAGAVAAYFLHALISIGSVKRRSPDIPLQALTSVCVDVLVISLLAYASGGLNGGFAALLILSIGAASSIVRQRLALLFATIATLALLVEQGFTMLVPPGDGGDFVTAGIVGALIFIVTLGIGPLARKLWQSDDLAHPPAVDLANLAELNQFIVQHLREGILVVDGNDSIRLSNESAAQLLQGAAVPSGTPLGQVSPLLLHQLDTWRHDAEDSQRSSLSLLHAEGGGEIQPRFVSLNGSNEGPALIFLDDAKSPAAQHLDPAQLATPRRPDAITVVSDDLPLSLRDLTRQEWIELTVWAKEFVTEFWLAEEVDRVALRLSSPGHDVLVRFDPAHLHQLLWNLCQNAVERARNAGTVDPSEIRIGCDPDTQCPFLEVHDRAPRIAAADADLIFEPSFAVNKGGRKGPGRGLLVARELAQSNGAVLTYEPRAGGGATLRLVFADSSQVRVLNRETAPRVKRVGL